MLQPTMGVAGLKHEWRDLSDQAGMAGLSLRMPVYAGIVCSRDFYWVGIDGPRAF